MIPGEMIAAPGEIELNEGAPTVTSEGRQHRRPADPGRQPLPFLRDQRGAALRPRQGARHAPRHPAGTAVRFEPGQERDVTLVPLAGKREVFGFQQKVMGKL